jgi:GNAT superfamily N-acetyltransferase
MNRSLPEGLLIRSIEPADATSLELFYAGLSIDSLDARFHGATRGISDAAARTFCGPDHDHREGLIATLPTPEGPVIVGHLCLEPTGVGDVEMAIAVADAWQHRGVGRAMLSAAIDWAVRHGISRLRADVLWSNPAIVGLLRSVQVPLDWVTTPAGDLEAVLTIGREVPVAA